jgi:glucosamine kinase
MADKLGDARLFAGIDGGGTKTLAVVVDQDGVERGRGLAGSANYGVVGQERAVAHINAAVSQALAQTDNVGKLAAAWIGLAGVDRPTDRQRLFPLLQPLAPVIELGNDGELALAALPRTQGVAVIAGTGAIVLGRDGRNEVIRASGWGHVFGDEGSGYDVGRLALQAAARAADGRGPSTALLPALVEHWNFSDPTGLIDRVYHDSRPGDIARLSSVVFSVAREGDLTARRIVRHAAEELALAVETVANGLSFAEGELPLAIGGGLLTGQADLRRSLLRRLRRRLRLGSVEIVAEPALSAARAARHLVE